MAMGGGLPQPDVGHGFPRELERVTADQPWYVRRGPGLYLLNEMVKPVSWIP